MTAPALRIFVPGALTSRTAWAWAWLAAAAVALVVTVTAALGLPVPWWVLLVLWAVTIAAAGWLIVRPPELLHVYDRGPVPAGDDTAPYDLPLLDDGS